jgi:NADH:ubiquinone oxidoreductase subunit
MSEPDPEGSMGLLNEIFAWWTGNTFGSRLTLWRTGAVRVGEDEFGNVYYRARLGKAPGAERRFVVYAREAEASLIPVGWHGWMHHTVDVPPSEEAYEEREWQKAFLPNMTGTPAAYRPKGSTLRTTHRPEATGDYQPWTPGD